MAINWVNQSQQPPPVIAQFLQDIWQWKPCFHILNVFHIYREANRAADYLASLARKGDFIINQIDALLLDLAHILWTDSYAIASFHK